MSPLALPAISWGGRNCAASEYLKSQISNLKSAIPLFPIDLPGRRRSIGGTVQRAMRP